MPGKSRVIWLIGACFYFLGIVASVSSFVRRFVPYNLRRSNLVLGTAGQIPTFLSMSASNSSSRTDDSNERNRSLKSTASTSLDTAHVETSDEEMMDLDEYCSVLDDFGCTAYEEILLDNDSEKPSRWIRLQGSPDECLRDIKTPEDVFHRIHEVREAQKVYGRADVYARSWNATVKHEKGDKEVNGAATNVDTPLGPSFSVMQFNTLAEGLSAGPDVKRPFNREPAFTKDNKKNNYGGFTNVLHPQVALDFSLRKWRLVEVILNSGSLFDIIALEEVDRYHGFFLPILKLFGYKGIFMPKIRAPGFNLGWYSDGCALLWKSDTFQLVSERRLVYSKGTQVLILATLQHRGSGEYLVVAVTHLKATRTAENERIRCEQVAELLRRVEDQVESTKKTADKQVRALILGDFNADPPSHAPIRNSCVPMVIDHGRKKSEVRRMRYRSAYLVDPPNPGFFTTRKTRGDETVQRVIDYIFYSECLTCSHTLGIPDVSEMEADQLPSLRYPSDHLMIAAKFEMNTWQQT